MKGLAIPQAHDEIYKDECIYSFASPFSPTGLYVNMHTWSAVGAEFLEFDSTSTGHKLYLLQKFEKIPVKKEEATSLAIGVKGGFGLDEYEVKKSYFIHVVGVGEVEYPFPEGSDYPDIVDAVAKGIINHAGDKIRTASTWEAKEELKPSKYAENLIQLEATKKISPNPKDWKCEMSGATDNLWLNLSDGYIGGGRKNWDGTGGSNGALDHFQEEKAKGNFYPLAVKLGTITKDGADVYSYADDENDGVLDPKLKEHLHHWGIDVMTMEKSEKTVAELEVELNQNYDWTRICESGEKLEPLHGPGLVGLRNLGNTCYMNSTLQMVSSIPEFSKRYQDMDGSFRKATGKNAPKDLSAQFAKLCTAIQAAPQEFEEEGLNLMMLRACLVKQHPEFSSNRQQDAAEFFSYLLDQVARSERSAASRLPAGRDLNSLFQFKVEERYENERGEVAYQHRNDINLSVSISKEDAKEEPEAKKMKIDGKSDEPLLFIPFETSFHRTFAPEEVENFRGSRCTKYIRMGTMPKYLLVQLQRYYVDEKWCPNKINCSTPMPDTLDLEAWRAKGKQANEVEMPAEQVPKFEPDEVILSSLESMGFSLNGAIKACKATKNAGVEQAMEYVMQHMEDPGFNDPEVEDNAGGAGEPEPDAGAVEMLTSMGFTVPQVKKALKACGNDIERSADWLFSRAGDLDDIDQEAQGTNKEEVVLDDGKGHYKLRGFVSHIGKHTSHGHYVFHFKGEDGKWVIYDDSKVARSCDPPLDLGYLYLYERQ